MATSTQTGLVISAAPIDPAFEGTPQEFFDHIVERMKIIAPFGISTFVISDTIPSSNVGPLLRGGTQWWVWDEALSTYVPLDVSESVDPPYQVSATPPADTAVPLWLQTDAGHTKFYQAYLYMNGAWRPLLGIVESGPTSSRPSSPANFQKYYDTDIETEIWWERGAWRTTSGVQGDVKFVMWSTLEEALERNPGWVDIGDPTGGGATQFRGRVLAGAALDADGSGGTADLEVSAGITKRKAGVVTGEETHVLTAAELAAHNHKYPQDKVPDTNPLDGNLSKSHEPYFWSDNREGGPSGTRNNHFGDGSSDAGNWRFRDLCDRGWVAVVGEDEAHNNIQPTLFLHCLRKL